jgi:hypothetical protein
MNEFLGLLYVISGPNKENKITKPNVLSTQLPSPILIPKSGHNVTTGKPIICFTHAGKVFVFISYYVN